MRNENRRGWAHAMHRQTANNAYMVCKCNVLIFTRGNILVKLAPLARVQTTALTQTTALR